MELSWSGPFVAPVIVGAVDVKITEEEAKYLEEPYLPQPVVGHTRMFLPHPSEPRAVEVT